MLQDPATIEPALDLILISRHLERIGDHATNIAEDVIFMVSAQGRPASSADARTEPDTVQTDLATPDQSDRMSDARAPLCVYCRARPVEPRSGGRSAASAASCRTWRAGSTGDYRIPGEPRCRLRPTEPDDADDDRSSSQTPLPATLWPTR